MCTHYRAPNEPEELNQLRLPLLDPLYEGEPWKQEIYPDYLAPIVRAALARRGIVIQVGGGHGKWRIRGPGTCVLDSATLAACGIDHSAARL